MWWFRSPVTFVNARFSGIDASRQATSRTALKTGLAFAGLFLCPKPPLLLFLSLDRGGSGGQPPHLYEKTPVLTGRIDGPAGWRGFLF